MLNERDRNGYTVWHIAAEYNTLQDIPQHLFTADSLSQITANDYETVWQYISESDCLKDVTEYLFTKEISNIRDRFDEEIFTEKQKKYIEDTMYSRKEMLNKFLLKNHLMQKI